MIGGGDGGGLGGFFEGVGQFLQAIPTPLLQGVGNALLPGNPFSTTQVISPQVMGPLPMAPTANLLPSAGGLPGALQLGPSLPQIGAGLMGMFDGNGGVPDTPFRSTPMGTQVARPFVATRDNGRSEWFIPAGKPTAWSKASIKRRRRCPR